MSFGDVERDQATPENLYEAQIVITVLNGEAHVVPKSIPIDIKTSSSSSSSSSSLMRMLSSNFRDFAVMACLSIADSPSRGGALSAPLTGSNVLNRSRDSAFPFWLYSFIVG